jgi:phosphate transport system substrate-binding protein
VRNVDVKEVAGKMAGSRRRKAHLPSWKILAETLVLAFVLTWIASVASAEPNAAPKGEGAAAKGAITIKGSDTMVILGQRWAEDFMKKHPEIKVQVMGGGSGTGIAALLNGSTDIAQSSRPIKAKEKVEFVKQTRRRVEEIPTALDGIAVYVHEGSPVAALTVEQLGDVFLGKIKNWKDLGGKDAPIVLYGRENSSGTYAFFKEHVLKELDFAPETQTLPGTAAIINAIGKDPNGIGYGGIGYSEGVKVVALKKDKDAAAIEPTEANVDNGSYPLSRELYFYLDPEKNKGVVKQFIDFCLGPDGQKVVSEVGYYPLKSKKSDSEGESKKAAESMKESETKEKHEGSGQ